VVRATGFSTLLKNQVSKGQEYGLFRHRHIRLKRSSDFNWIVLMASKLNISFPISGRLFTLYFIFKFE
jgi:hypothetical protein